MTRARGRVKEGRAGRRKGRKVEYKAREIAERRGWYKVLYTMLQNSIKVLAETYCLHLQG
jgi:hypothetical protein